MIKEHSVCETDFLVCIVTVSEASVENLNLSVYFEKLRYSLCVK